MVANLTEHSPCEFGLEVGDHEQGAEKKIRCGEDEVGRMHAALLDQSEDGHTVIDFFQYRRNHQRAKANWVRGDEEKRDLPGQPESHESIEESWMGDGRWISAADQIKHEVQRSDDQQAPNAGNPEHYLGKYHLPSHGWRFGDLTEEAVIGESRRTVQSRSADKLQCHRANDQAAVRRMGAPRVMTMVCS